MHTAPSLPADIRRLILTSIPSVPFLEALLLLYRSPGKRMSAGDVARQLYIPEAETAQLLDAMAAAGFCRLQDDSEARTYRFERDGEKHAALIDSLAQCYATHLVEVTHLIHDKTQRDGTRFADAFKLRKDR
jgi:DNA-binding IclR family transcriptional regulator